MKHFIDRVKYECNQCDYRATTQIYLTYHIQSLHIGLNYDCNQWDYKATIKGSLTLHKESVIKGVKYHILSPSSLL